MGTKITGEVLEGFLACKLKGHLKLKGEPGNPSDYQTLMAEQKDRQRAVARPKLLGRHGGDEVLRGVKIGISTLKLGAPLILDSSLEDDALALHIDGLMRVEGPSRLGSFHYVPILVVEGEKIKPEQRRFLELLGLIIGDLQAKQPAVGVVVRGKGAKLSRVRLKPGSRATRAALEEAKRLSGNAEFP
jgi:predicted RecB family nuclease